MNNKILHISPMDKFIPPFIDFMDENFDITHHTFVILGKPRYKYGLKEDRDIIWIDSIWQILKMIVLMNKSDKIILHGLFSEILNTILFMQPWILKKCYWVMWGGDFYFPEKQHWIKKQVIKRMGHTVAYIKGDYNLAQEWYGLKGKYHECFKYPTNIYKEYDIKEQEHKGVNILLGNSADPTNNHIEMIEKLKKYKHEDINILVPLSYGDVVHANKVVKYGKDIFGDKFHPMIDFMPFKEYLEFLGKIDIAIFAHKRQQAMGNTITLLGLGKKVYMRSDITPWKFFEEIAIKLFDVKDISLELFNETEKRNNRKKIKEYFSEENYIKQLKELFNE